MINKYEIGDLVVINEKRQVYKIIYKLYTYKWEYSLQNIKSGNKLILCKTENQLRIATPVEIVKYCHV